MSQKYNYAYNNYEYDKIRIQNHRNNLYEQYRNLFFNQENEINESNNEIRHINIEENEENNDKTDKNINNDFAQSISLNDKFITQRINLETNSNNNLFYYVPEENIQGLYSIFIENKSTLKLKYLKHNCFLGNKRNNENNNEINITNEQIVGENNVDIIFKNIFKNRKNFYSNYDIKKNLDKEYYINFINNIAYKYNKDKTDIIEFNNFIYSTYKSLDKLYLCNISSCYLKERTLKTNDIYFSKKDIIINSLFILINNKIEEISKLHQEEIMFIGESGMGKTYSLYLYAYILRLNPFNLVISIFELNEFIENPVLYLQKEIAYSLYYVCANNNEFDLKELTDCLIIDKDNIKMNYDILMDMLNSLMSKIFEVYNNKLSLYIIIDGFEKAENKDNKTNKTAKELIDQLITSLYNVSITYFGTENKEFLDRFKVIYFCNSDEFNSDILIKEKISDFSKKKIFSSVNYSNFFDNGIIFLEPELIYSKEEISFFIEKNKIKKDEYIDNKIKDKIIKNIMDYTDCNFKKILWIIKDNNIMNKIKEDIPVIIKYFNNNLEEWLYDTIFQFQKISFKKQVSIYHFIYSCQNLNEINENLTQSFFINGFRSINYSLIIPKIIKNHDNFYIAFKLKNRNLTVFLKNLDMDKLYKKINLNEVDLNCLINEYSSTKSAILRGLILEEMIFVIFKSALKEKKILKLNFNVQTYAKKALYNEEDTMIKNDQMNVIITNVEKAMSKEDDFFEKEYLFMNDIEDNDGIYFLSHKFPCIDSVIKNGKNLYLIQIKKTLKFEHILQLNEDMHYYYIMENEDIFKELVRQNEIKMRKNNFNTKLNFFIKLYKLKKKNFNFKFIFIYQAKESTLNVSTFTDEINIKEKFEKENIEVSYRLEDIWRGPNDNNNKDIFKINNDYFLKIKCKRVYNNILLSTIDKFTADIQNILKISRNENFFSTLKE